MNKSEQLIHEFEDLIIRSVEECLSHKGYRDVEGKVYCKYCAFSWSFSMGNQGCFLVELYNGGQVDNLISAMNYRNINTDKLQGLEFMKD